MPGKRVFFMLFVLITFMLVIGLPLLGALFAARTP